MCAKKVWKWAAAGPGRIARSFCTALRAESQAELTEVYSTDETRARAFAEEFGVPVWRDSYEAIRDSKADIFYLANLHPQHYETAKIILGAGKHLLCEKPLCLNGRQARELYRIAEERGLFFMEAMWTSMQPATRRVRAWLASGAIGEVTQLDTSFGFRAALTPDNRLYAKRLGGGALLDLGVYGLAYAVNIMGTQTQRLEVLAHQSEEGVDQTCSLILDYGSGRYARGTFSMEQQLPGLALISGEKGYIRVHRFHHPYKAELFLYCEQGPAVLSESYEQKNEVNGYEYEAREVMRCLDEGLSESPLHPKAYCLKVMDLMDEVRAKIGLHYENE